MMHLYLQNMISKALSRLTAGKTVEKTAAGSVLPGECIWKLLARKWSFKWSELLAQCSSWQMECSLFFLCMFQPAPPSWLTSTDPPLLWEDTSHRPRLTLSGKHTTHSRHGFSICNPTTPSLSPQEWDCSLSVQAALPPASGAAGGAEKLYSEQGDGAQRVQTVPLRPGSKWLRAHVYWPSFPGIVLRAPMTGAEKQTGKFSLASPSLGNPKPHGGVLTCLTGQFTWNSATVSDDTLTIWMISHE